MIFLAVGRRHSPTPRDPERPGPPRRGDDDRAQLHRGRRLRAVGRHARPVGDLGRRGRLLLRPAIRRRVSDADAGLLRSAGPMTKSHGGRRRIRRTVDAVHHPDAGRRAVLRSGPRRRDLVGRADLTPSRRLAGGLDRVPARSPAVHVADPAGPAAARPGPWCSTSCPRRPGCAAARGDSARSGWTGGPTGSPRGGSHGARRPGRPAAAAGPDDRRSSPRRPRPRSTAATSASPQGPPGPGMTRSRPPFAVGAAVLVANQSDIISPSQPHSPLTTPLLTWSCSVAATPLTSLYAAMIVHGLASSTQISNGSR